MKNSNNPKPTPQRTCVVCRQVRAKRELVRLVRTPEGSVEIDVTGKKAGRGAYLCRQWACWEAGLQKGNPLEHALRVQVSQQEREELLKMAEELIKATD